MSSGIERKNEMSKVLKQDDRGRYHVGLQMENSPDNLKGHEHEKAMNISRMLREQQGSQSDVARGIRT